MRRPLLLAISFASCCLAQQKFSGPNMNGEYVISPTPNAPKGVTFNTNWSQYPGGVEYFDVYMGPITHRYAEVFWTGLPQTPVPTEIQKRFAGKGMAIVGYEVDQVRRKGDRDVDGSILQEDVSVPINIAYNHHHDLSLIGAGSRMEKIPYDANDPTIPSMMRADPHFITVPVQHTPSPLGIPTHAGLHEGNGGEYRKSYHGFAAPVAYLVDSPKSVFVLPMQIDTWNRDEMNITGSRFVPGPQPKHSLAPQGPGAMYSGLLECPLTDRVKKTIPGGVGYKDTYKSELFQCPSASANGSHPTDQHVGGYARLAWAQLHALVGGATVPGAEELNLFWNPSAGKGDHWLTFGAEQAANATRQGYTLVRHIGSAPTAQSKLPKKPVYLHYSAGRGDHFTSMHAAPPAGFGYVAMGRQGFLLESALPQQRSVPLAWYWSAETAGGRSTGSTSGDNVLAQDDGPNGNKPTSCAHLVSSAAHCFAAAKAMDGMGNATVQTSQGASGALPTGCTVTFDADAGAVKAFYNTQKTGECCGAGVDELRGSADALVGLKMSVSNATVEITLTGPSTVWFGVGFFAETMEQTPYSIIVDGTGSVSERRIANHAIGRLLAPTVAVVRNTVLGGERTVVLSRPALSHSTDYANFTLADLTIPFISAIGSTAALAYHKAKTTSTLAMWPSTQQPVCLCSQPAAPFGSAVGTIQYLPTGEEFGFVNYCYPEPRESVLQQKNPTCDIRAYVGGLQVCKHMWTLLDADQENDERVQRWKKQPLTYYQKYRIYFQDYVEGHHIGTIPRQGWGIGAAGGQAEYDVPQCPPGTPVEDCTHEIWGVLTPGGTDLYLAAIHFHCHAPTCLEMALYNNVTGQLVCSEKPIYGGTGQIDLPKFDEAGYILQPPCIWGDQPGLEPMPKASGVRFLIKAITNSTYGHHGEMAFPEVTLVPWRNTSAFATE